MVLRACAVGMFLFLLAGCGQSPPDPTTVTMAIEQPPTNLDPRVGTDAISERLAELIFSSLVRRDEASRIVPDLASGWETPDPTTYVFHLRTGVRFHDGRPLAADDVVYTFRSMLEGSVETPKAGSYALIESVEAPDPATVVFRLSEPWAPFLWNLSAGAIGIVPSGADTESVRVSPVGSGPFAFVHYRADDEILLERNPDYFGPIPEVRSVRLRIVPDAVVRALELQNGTIDIVLNALPPDMVDILGSSDTLEVLNTPGTNYQYLAFNLEDPVLGDLRVRRAIAHAIDRDSIVRYLLRGQARLADSLLPPENWAHSDDVARYDYDPAEARRILEAAGYGDLRLTYKTATDPTGLLIASVLQDQLGRIGIRMEIRSNEFATFYADVVGGSFQMYSLRWIGGNNDPDMFSLVFHSSMTPPNGANRGRYRNADVDRWIEAARSASDIETRRADYARIQKTVSEELPYVSLWYLNNVAVYNRRIKDLSLGPAGNFDFLTRIRIDPTAPAQEASR